MVQRKAPNKVAPKRSPGKPDRNQQQDTGGKGDDDDDLKKTQMRPIKSSNPKNKKDQSMDHHPQAPRRSSAIKNAHGSPNYMKPTSSSDARKAQDQVTPHPQPQSKANPQKKPINLNHSSSTLKPFKILSRKSSFKIIKPSIKNKATCSSTLKDSKFPKALDLNPGGTEAEGTSAARVCHYSYCSLNGHKHPPLPPLRPFMSARRSLLKTQKSFKLKGLSLFRSKDPVRGEGEMDTSQFGISRTSSGLRITPLIEEVVNDFFVDIYAKPHNQKLELESTDGVSAGDDDHPNNHEILGGLSQDCAKAEINEDNREALDEIVEFNTCIVSEDDQKLGLESTDEISAGDDAHPNNREILDGSSANAEINEDNREAIDAIVEFNTDIVSEDDQKLGLESADEISAGKDDHPNNREILDGSSAKAEINEDNREALDEIDEFNASIVFEDDHDKRSTLSVEEMDDLINLLEYVECDQHIELEPENYPSLVLMIEGNADFVEKDDTDDVGSEKSAAGSNDEKEEYACDLSFLGEQDDETIEVGCESISKEEVDAFASSFPSFIEKSSVGHQDGGNEDALPDQDVNANCISDDESFEPAGTKTRNELNEECTDEEIIATVIAEIEKMNDEGEEQSSLLIVEHSQQCQDSTETDENNVGGDQIQMVPEIEEHKNDEATDGLSTTPVILAASTEQSNENYDDGNRKNQEECEEDVNETKESTIETEEQCSIEDGDENQIEYDDESDDDATCLIYTSESSKGDKPVKTTRANRKHRFADANEKPKLRITITRKPRTEETEENKEFNPRSPTFLPVEPDPEAEKVDLKHQTMDERKNSEAWMLDYALQQAVSKLAPARKKKVALLVEAFETVAPLPLRHATSGFDHARTMQACS